MNREQAMAMLNEICGIAEDATMTGAFRNAERYAAKMLARVSSALRQNQWLDEETYQLLDVDGIVSGHDVNMSEVGMCAKMLQSAVKAAGKTSEDRSNGPRFGA